MRILMMTNTYTPLVGGLERSVKSFAEAYRRRGHRVIVVAPSFQGMPRWERDVIRVPALQHFSGTDFSVRLPIPGLLARALRHFQPEIVHAHHPFLLGDTALRIAMAHQAPLVFTHHILFEQYTHYLPIAAPPAERFLTALATTYANLCDRVFSPSHSVAQLLRTHGVHTPIDVVPTGVSLARFRHGRAQACRAAAGIPADAFVVGHLGRLAPEKNLGVVLAAYEAVKAQQPRARLVFVGDGPMRAELAARAPEAVFAGQRSGDDLAAHYAGLDLFLFPSLTETFGNVTTEAMASGCAVVAFDSAAAGELIRSGVNGWLAGAGRESDFVAAARVAALDAPARALVSEAARATARRLDWGDITARFEGVLETAIARAESTSLMPGLQPAA